MKDKTPTDILKQFFGYVHFRPGQDDTIQAILQGNDVLAVMPTGAGKSLCYQIPALIFPGVTLVVSPLISLMRDQVAALISNGIAAAFINSSLSPSQTETALTRAAEGLYKIIYVAPERLDNPSFLHFARNVNISMLAVDEAHCVSHWGQDFRPSYLQIMDFIQNLPNRPAVTAFTATATDVVKGDIIKLLGLHNPVSIATGFNRENLYFEVRRPRDKYTELLNIVRERKDKNGIIYCNTRKTVEEVYAKLSSDGFFVCAYHAGMSQYERNEAQQAFTYDQKKLIVATNAFGMGIDKSDVAFVVHYNMPKNMESYYQEAGRAGRDGSPAECILFFNPQDIIINKFLIEQTDAENPLPPDVLQAAKNLDYKRLKQMETYCKTTNCLRQYILEYFGDSVKVTCSNCANCIKEKQLKDITVSVQKILSCVYRLDGRYGASTIADILRGAETDKIFRLGLNKIKSYKIMADNSIRQIREIIDFLMQEDYIHTIGDEFPVVAVTEKAESVLRGTESVFMPVFAEEVAEEVKQVKVKQKSKPVHYDVNQDLFNSLKKLRLELAKEESVPAFVIFSDATLTDMCIKRPANESEMLQVSGVGQIKLEKYGGRFLAVLNDFN